VSDKFEFIDAQHAAQTTNTESALPTVKMCVLLGVSRSGFYEWRARPASATAERREELKALVRTSFDDSDGTYGYRRVHADLVARGVRCGPELVRSVMRELGLEPCQPKPWRFSLTDSDGQEHHIPDLVRRDFTAEAPGHKMVGDITHIPTWEGWVYLATVIDCYTKAVVGWPIGDDYKTPLIEKAIEMAARNHPLADDAIFHSDRGSEYTAAKTAAACRALGVTQSMGRVGCALDNAAAEAFNTRAQGRVHPPADLQDPSRSPHQDLNLDRRLLQHQQETHRERRPRPDHIRTSNGRSTENLNGPAQGRSGIRTSPHFGGIDNE
jgi:putative transposase